MLEKITEKKCTKCGTIKHINLFSKCKSRKDGLQTKCKKCYKEYCILNKEKLKEKQQQYYSCNKESWLEKNRNRYLENREYIINKKKQYYKDNLEQISIRKKIYSKTDKAKAISKNSKDPIGFANSIGRLL